ncbi:hypothetical protein JB92DRAFT_2944096 [Gautieria morchelliformis]|nr:hypothetical protein JB92DRAFT_2944096 [Gautieria morchelliformis]
MTRSEELYMDGGNLIVAVNVAFRVHISLLARRPELFRDMFAVALYHLTRHVRVGPTLPKMCCNYCARYMIPHCFIRSLS